MGCRAGDSRRVRSARQPRGSLQRGARRRRCVRRAAASQRSAAQKGRQLGEQSRKKKEQQPLTGPPAPASAHAGPGRRAPAGTCPCRLHDGRGQERRRMKPVAALLRPLQSSHPPQSAVPPPAGQRPRRPRRAGRALQSRTRTRHKLVVRGVHRQRKDHLGVATRGARGDAVHRLQRAGLAGARSRRRAGRFSWIQRLCSSRLGGRQQAAGRD